MSGGTYLRSRPRVIHSWVDAKLGGTVDGRNPAPPGMYETL